MTEELLGAAPIDPKFRAVMNDLAADLDTRFNPGLKGAERMVGFVLLVFPCEGCEGLVNYISNTNRADVVTMLKEQLARFAPEVSPWRPIATAPKDGTRILVLCEFANGREPTVVRWVDSPAPAGPFGRFAWREMQDSAIAESVPKFWMPIPDAPEAIQAESAA